MSDDAASGRYPGYDVLAKRDGLSWNDRTREVIDARLAVEPHPEHFSAEEWRTLEALCDRVRPQPAGRPRVPLAAYVDRKIKAGDAKGYRFADMPEAPEAWRRGLAALEEAERRDHGRRSPVSWPASGTPCCAGWRRAPFRRKRWRPCRRRRSGPRMSFTTSSAPITRILKAGARSAGAGPLRGYVRLGLNRRDSWGPVESEPGREAEAARVNKHVR